MTRTRFDRMRFHYTWDCMKCGRTNVRSMKEQVDVMRINAGGMNKPQGRCKCGSRRRLSSENTTYWISRLDAELIAEAKNKDLSEVLPEDLGEYLGEYMGESWRLEHV